MPSRGPSRSTFDYVDFETSLKSKLTKQEKQRFREIVRSAKILPFARGELRIHSVSPYVVGFIEHDWYTSLDQDGDLDIEFTETVTPAVLKTFEESFSTYLRTISNLMKRSIEYEVDLTLHVKTNDSKVKNFVRVSTAMANNSYIPEILGKQTSVKGLYLRLDKDAELICIAPGHLDFTFTFKLSSQNTRKGYLQTYLTRAYAIISRLR